MAAENLHWSLFIVLEFRNDYDIILKFKVYPRFKLIRRSAYPQLIGVASIVIFNNSLLSLYIGMLLRWFVYLYNLEIVEEEAFLKWREDDVTDAYPGKGEALFQVFIIKFDLYKN